MRRRNLACALLPILLAGCGGSGHKSSSTSSTDTIGPQIALAWPARARSFGAPVAATAARIVFPSAGTNGNDISEVVLRPDGAAAVTKTYQLGSAVHPGRHLLRVEFLANSSDSDALGVATLNVQVTNDGSLRKLSGGELGTVAYGSNVTALKIEAGQAVEVGQTADLLVDATANGNTVALKPGSVTFALASGGLLTLGADGSVMGVAEGTASLTASVDGVTSAAMSVTVLPAPVTARTVSLDSADMAFDPIRGALWVATSRSIARLDPGTGSLGTSILIGGSANTLAISDDGTTLLAGVNTLAVIQQVDLGAGVAGPAYTVTSPYSSDATRYATNIAIQPGSTSVYAITSNDTSGAYAHGPTVYDAGVARAIELGPFQGNSLVWTGTDHLAVTGGYGAGIYDVAVDAQGATIARQVATSRAVGSLTALVGGRLYDNTGFVLDAASLQVVGAFDLTSPLGPYSSAIAGPAVDAAAGRAYFVEVGLYGGTSRVRVYDTRTLEKLSDRRIAGLTPSYLTSSDNVRVSLVGSDRLAFRLPNQVVFLDGVSKL